MTRKRKGGAGSAGDGAEPTANGVDWREALYGGKRSALRRIAFTPATRAESGKVAARVVVQNSDRPRDDVSGGSGSQQSAAPGPSSRAEPPICLDWKVTFRPGAGLRNLGNTCFMNSVLQCLTYTPPLAQVCLTPDKGGLPAEHSNGGGFDAMQAFTNHVNKVLRSPGAVVPPYAFSRHLRALSSQFRLGRQEDAHEFFRCLIDGMDKVETDANKRKAGRGSKGKGKGKAKAKPPAPRTLVDRVFGGALSSQVRCTRCDYTSTTRDPILDLSLELSGAGGSGKGMRITSLNQALGAFTKPEILDGSNQYNCPRCKRGVRAVKQMLMDATPNVLAVQLKRFAFGKHGTKIERMVHFPLALDMGAFVRKGTGTGAKGGAGSSKATAGAAYALYAILVHSGHSLHSGHYYCFVRCPSSGWVCCDDSSVRPVSEKKVLEQRAYMLFYRREAPAPVPPQGAAGRKATGRAEQPAEAEQPTPAEDAKAALKQAQAPPSPPANGISGMNGAGPALGLPLGSPLVSRSPSLQRSGWRRFLLHLPGKFRLQYAAKMQRVVREIMSTRPARKGTRRSKRIAQRRAQSSAGEEPRSPEESPRAGDGVEVGDGDGDGEGEGVRALVPAEDGLVAADMDVERLLHGDGGQGPYGAAVGQWEGADGALAAAAAATFKEQRPTRARRSRYDEDYDAGRAPKRRGGKGGTGRLGPQRSAFQSAIAKTKQKFGRHNKGKKSNRRG